MTPERFGELVGAIAWGLLEEGSREEAEVLMLNWGEVKKTLPHALIAAQVAIGIKRSQQGNH